MDMTRVGKKGRGRGASRGGAASSRGKGRGRGRGGGSKTLKTSAVDLDDEDELCNMALAQAELESNSLTKSFEELNCATELPGFDPMSGNIWIYPTNRPVRDYQYEIVKTSLFNNTLVSLPTGLGKTFISAVVMYNFSRWYPSSLIIFMAPTRPLVAQQLDACHNTVGISPSKTIELTGQIPPKKREQLWNTKTVFFLTPQVMLSDLERNYFPPEKVRCIVVDEAHKALGNHAYAQVISKIARTNRLFRVLALSATPGSDMLAVQQIFKNLLISRVELRSDQSLDILPYIHDKKVETVVVKLDPYLKSVHQDIIQVFQTYTGKLLKQNALQGRDGFSFGKYQLLKARETWRNGPAKTVPSYQKSFIELDFAVCITLAHSTEILLSHGLRTFYTFLMGVLNKEKGMAATTHELKKTCISLILDNLQEKLQINPENSTFDFDLSVSGLYDTVDTPRRNQGPVINKSFADVPIDYTLSHPKLKVLKDLVQQHFDQWKYKNETTRIMIFSQYRDSVQEIGCMLSALRPLVKPMVFIGHGNSSGKGLKQKEQVQVVQQFRDGGFNVLVSTSVGEEGLDIGEVDMIICFDASRSPTRLIQRMGRTGRKREGRTVFLLTEGKEERSYSSSLSSHSSISKNITDPQRLQPYLYAKSPRMVPVGIEPECYKMQIVLTTEQTVEPVNDVSEDEDKPVKEVKAKVVKKKKVVEKKPSTPVPASNNIVKMFEKIRASSQDTPKRPDLRKIASPPPPIPAHVLEYNEPIVDMEQGMVDFCDMNDSRSKFSLLPSIFDINRSDRHEWKPCTSFFKKNFPPTRAVGKGFTVDQMILGESALARIERRIKQRQGFMYKNNEFCECGNVMEQHGNHKNDCTTFNETTTKDFAIRKASLERVSPLKTDKGGLLAGSLFSCSSKENVADVTGVSGKESFNGDETITKDFIVRNSSLKRVESPKKSDKRRLLADSVFNDSTREIVTEETDAFVTDTELNNARSSLSAPVILEEPFIEEEFDEDIPLEMFDDYEDPWEPEEKQVTSLALSSNKDLNTIPESAPLDTSESVRMKTPEPTDSSDDEVLFASPEVGANRYLEELRQLKLRKNTEASMPHSCPVFVNASTSKEKPTSPLVRQNVRDESLSIVSKKKFTFKKKGNSPVISVLSVEPTVKAASPEKQIPIQKLMQDETNLEVLDLNDSPPLSPILNLPEVTNDLFKVPFPPTKSPGNRKLFRTSPVKHDSPPKVRRQFNFKKSGSNIAEPDNSSDQTVSEDELDINIKPQGYQTSPITSKPTPTKRRPYKIEPLAVRGYTAEDLKLPTETEYRPIMRKDPTPDSSFLSALPDIEFKVIRKPNFEKSASVTSTSSTSSSSVGMNRPGRNLLSRNRPTKRGVQKVSQLLRSPSPTPPRAPCPKSPPNPYRASSTPSFVSARPASFRAKTPQPPVVDLEDDNSSPEIVVCDQPTPPVQPKTPVSSFRRRSSEMRTSTPVTPYSFRQALTQSSRTPTPLRYTQNTATLLGEDDDDDDDFKDTSRVSSTTSPFVFEHQQLVAGAAGRKRKKNPFVFTQAEVEDDDDEFGNDNDEYDHEYDVDDDSFVTQQQDDGVSASEHGMYLKSIRDAIPARFGRIEKPLSPKYRTSALDTTGGEDETYEGDSFCQQDDDVEFADVGVFTQAMHKAKAELANTSTSFTSRPRTRRAKQKALASKQPETKRRRRIVTFDDSSDSD